MLRFLWFLDPLNIDGEVVHLHFTRLVFRLRQSVAILGEVIQQHCNQFQQEHLGHSQIDCSVLICRKFDFRRETVEDAFNLYQAVKNIMAKEGFNLRKWNSPTL